jgi:phospholipid/cholesterol/gamma-HCH transport system substrate-binding protein
LRAYFENAAGLVKGAPVRLSGVDIGNVDAVHYVSDPKRKSTPVEVVMKVSSHHQNEVLRGTAANQYKDGSLATLETAGVLGATFVDIDSSKAAGPPVKDGDELKTTESPGVQDVLKASQGTLEKLNTILNNVNNIVDTIQNGRGSVGKLINDPELYNHANGLVQQLQTLTTQINQGKGSVGKLLASDELYNKLDDTVTKFSQIVDEINAGKGNVGKFLKDEQLYNNINQTTASIRDLMNDIDAGKGTLGLLAKNKEYAAKIDRLTTDLEQISNRLAAGEGSAGLLLKDPRLYNNADQMLIESRNLVKAIRENPKKYLTIHFKIF